MGNSNRLALRFASHLFNPSVFQACNKVGKHSINIARFGHTRGEQYAMCAKFNSGFDVFSVLHTSTTKDANLRINRTNGIDRIRNDGRICCCY